MDLPPHIHGDYNAYAADHSTAVVNVLPPSPAPSRDEIAAARALLNRMPVDVVPEVGSLPAGSRMLLAPNPLFVGRTDELRQLALLLREGEVTALVAATGMGGIGKTQLAAEFAHRYGQFFAGGVFWLSLANAEGVQAEMLACIDPARYPHLSGLPPEDRSRAMWRIWQEPLPRLLIFDNCEEEALLRHWRPPTGGSRVLLTSRRPDWAADLGVRPLPLGLLAPEDAVALLRKHRADPPAQDPDLAALAHELGYLALALHLAGSVLARYRRTLSPAAYLVRLRRSDLLEVPWLEGREGSPTGHDASLTRTFALSYERLDPASPTDLLARALLARAALLAPGEPIPRPLLLATLLAPGEPIPAPLLLASDGAGGVAPNAGEDLEAAMQAEDAVLRLVELGLLETAAGSVRLHRLLAASVRAVASDGTARPAVERGVLIATTNALATGSTADLLAVRPHLQTVTDAALGRDDEWASTLCNAMGVQLRATATYAQARTYLERALAIQERVLGPDHPAIATSLNNLAILLRDQGDYPGARPLYERSLAIAERAHGPDHPLTATGLNNLAALLMDQGDLAAAGPPFERALAIRERALGPDHPLTAFSLNNLAQLLVVQGDLARARPLLERALTIRERALGPDHPDTATGLNNLAALLVDQGDYPGARPLYERSLAIRERTLGPDHPLTASSLNNLACLLRNQGDYTGARPLYERSLATRERTLGPDHPDTATGLGNLATLLLDQGDYTGARPLYGRALAILERALGPDHPNTATGLCNLAALLVEQGDLVGARPLLDRALAITERALGSDHSDTVLIRKTLGYLP